MSDVLHNGSSDMWPEEWKSEEALVRATPHNIYILTVNYNTYRCMLLCVNAGTWYRARGYYMYIVIMAQFTNVIICFRLFVRPTLIVLLLLFYVYRLINAVTVCISI